MNIESLSCSGVPEIIFGLIFLILNKLIARQAVYWNMRLWKLVSREEQYRLLFVLVGVVMLIVGILVSLDVMHFRG